MKKLNTKYETALIHLVDQLLFNLDYDKVTGLVFINESETKSMLVTGKRLMKKMEHSSLLNLVRYTRTNCSG